MFVSRLFNASSHVLQISSVDHRSVKLEVFPMYCSRFVQATMSFDTRPSEKIYDQMYSTKGVVPFISTRISRSILNTHSLERWTKLFSRTFISVIILLCFSRLSNAAPASDERPEDVPTSKAVGFLMKFGYLPQSGIETGNLQTEDQIVEGIKSMQKYGGLKPTGILDKETLELMNKPRCGLPDDITQNERAKRFVLQGAKWNKHTLTYMLDNWSNDLGYDNCRREIYNAFKVWSDVSALTFYEVGSGDADIHIQFAHHYHGDGYPFDGPGNVLAHAFFPAPDRGGDCHFDEDEEWTQYESKGVNLFSVAAHEFGHSLGLSHTSVQGALMFPYYQGYKKDFQLHYDDIIGITTLYGSRPYEGTHDGGAVDDPYDPYPGGEPPKPPPKPPHKPPHKPQPPKQPPSTPKPTTPPKVKPEDGKPDTCDTSYDAISMVRGEVFIFKGKYFWRLDNNGLMENYPFETREFWYGLPRDFTHVDAVYERPSDNKIVMFIGNTYYVFNGNTKEPNYPQLLTNLGLPEELPRIDAAMVWGHNGKTYLFYDTMYWRFDEEGGKVELDYPRDMKMWRGVPYSIDAAFRWRDGHTYFFKGKKFWKFNDQRMMIEKSYPMYSAQFWMDCPKNSVADGKIGRELISDGVKGSGEICLPSTYILVLTEILLVLWFVLL